MTSSKLKIRAFKTEQEFCGAISTVSKSLSNQNN